jgi:hypothetical protein
MNVGNQVGIAGSRTVAADGLCAHDRMPETLLQWCAMDAERYHSTEPNGSNGVYLYGIQSEDEQARIFAALSRIYAGYLADVTGSPAGPIMELRGGTTEPVEASYARPEFRTGRSWTGEGRGNLRPGGEPVK